MRIEDLAVSKAIDAELTDPRYTGTHGTAYCYGRGCKGPLCTYANRKRKGSVSELDDLLDYRLGMYLEERRQTA